LIDIDRSQKIHKFGLVPTEVVIDITPSFYGICLKRRIRTSPQIILPEVAVDICSGNEEENTGIAKMEMKV
jgi:hypothetical protein